MDEKRLAEERAKAEGFAMGVRWARRRFGEAISDALRGLEKSLSEDDDWILGVKPFQYPDNVCPKPYARWQVRPLSDDEVRSIAADIEQAGEEDTAMPF